jgi:hypothetical protein
MPDSEIERRIRGELSGTTNLDERFRVVSAMTDWENLFGASGTFGWHGMPLVPWDSTRHEMLIPLASIRTGVLLNFPSVDSMIAIGFDGDGRVESVERRDVDRKVWPFPFSGDWEVNLIEDPWLQSFPQHNTRGSGAMLWYGVPVTVHVDANDWWNSRWVDLHIWVAGVDAEKLLTVPRVTASDSTEIVHIRAEGPEMTRPQVAGAFIVPSYWDRPYTGHIPEQYRVSFFPSVMATYRMLFVLEPHDGVDLTIEVLAEEATP